MTEVVWRDHRTLPKTAAERRFDAFVAVVEDLGCEHGLDRLGTLVTELVPVRRPRESDRGAARSLRQAWREDAPKPMGNSPEALAAHVTGVGRHMALR